MNYSLVFIATFLLSLFLTYFVKEFSYKYNLLSKPRARDVHKKAIPRIGGIAMFASFLVVAIAVFFLLCPNLSFGYGNLLSLDRRLIGILVGGLVITVIMLYDDIRGLKVWQKLLAQVFVTLIVIASGIGINYLSNPFGDRIDLNTIYIPLFVFHGVVYHFSLLSDMLTLVWMVGMMNIINFVDGVDGLAGGLSTIAFLTIFLLSTSLSQSATAMIAIILAGSSAGFLCWNFPPAKIFMGDSGSMFLGFMLGVLPLISGGKLATVFLVLGFPIVDGLIVAMGRILRGKNPAAPDKTHLHHRFLLAGFSPRVSVLSIYVIAIAFGWVALRATTDTKILASIVLVSLIVSLILILEEIRRRKAR